MKKIISVAFLLGFFLVVDSLQAQTTTHIPSDSRGDPQYRRSSSLNGNNVRVTVHNFGVNGRVSDDSDWSFEWPKNTNREHIVFVSIWLGGEVITADGATHQLIDLPTYNESPEGDSWNMEPVPGFLNPSSGEVARSDKSETWPGTAQGGWRDKRDDETDPGWIGSWNGFFGKNIFNADLEMFYRASDDNYAHNRYIYYPDETDSTRRGLGLLLDVRAFAWTQVLINDVVFFINDIKNDGTKRLEKTTFMIWLADLVGGDSSDDEPFVDLQTDIAFLTDRDRIGTDPWGDDPVGLGAVKFLETPGNQVDGIDNDGDADNDENSALLSMIDGDADERVPLFVEDDFDSRSVSPGDKIVLIDSVTFERQIVEYPSGGGTVYSLGQKFELPSGGTTLMEDTTADLIDNDLDGLIDEKLTLHFERYNEVTGTTEPVRYINYLSFEIGDTLKRGFIVPGNNTEMSYETMAPMVDESRDDGFDNDNDWNFANDDFGLDGAAFTGDEGEGDGMPTSGANTEFPGEPNLDKTDVSETDLIGITSVVVDPAFGVSFDPFQDERVWKKFMTPGTIINDHLTGEYDTYVASGYFPIDPGERQRMAVSVAMAGGGTSKDADIESAITKQSYAKAAYDSDYQFAQAPLQVTVTAVPGDGKVTLYWDDLAEESEDNYIKKMGGPYQDFEGYRVYRSTDAAFTDAKVITDGQGNALLLRPIAQFDLEDEIYGYHPVAIEGVQFDLGDDTGLQHSYIDTGLVNGQRYFYAVTAYDFGYEFNNIPPTETAISVNQDQDGTLEMGTNVVAITPRAAAAGYLPSEIAIFEHSAGYSSGEIGFEIVDPRAILEGNEYEITFEDTVIRGTADDFLTTKNFTLKNITTDSILIEKSTLLDEDDELPIVEGFRMTMYNESKVELIDKQSYWSDSLVFEYQFSPVQFFDVAGLMKPADYEVVFGDVGFGQSMDTSISSSGITIPLAATDVNFKIYDLSNNRQEVKFAFAELDGNDGKFSINPDDADYADVIMLLEDNNKGTLIYTWQLILNTLPSNGRNPEAGDTLHIEVTKPFLSTDVYNFQTQKESIDKELAKSELDDIRVVPNPYIVTATWEPSNNYTNGRGERQLHFINLPSKCTIRIFNVAGDLIDKLEFDGEASNDEEIDGLSEGEDSGANNGMAIWDMLSKDNLEISYGIYLYHVDAPGIGEKTGIFTIIK